jgi:hypothetical protein
MIAVARFIERDLNSSDSFDSIALLNTYRRTACRELRAIRRFVLCALAGSASGVIF